MTFVGTDKSMGTFMKDGIVHITNSVGLNVWQGKSNQFLSVITESKAVFSPVVTVVPTIIEELETFHFLTDKLPKVRNVLRHS
jgi:hypothetical protein